MENALNPGVVATLTRRPADPDLLGQADYCEVRADLWSDGADQAIASIPSLPKPVIFTCRIPEEGGRFQGTPEVREALFRKALQAGAGWVDIEGQCHSLLEKAGDLNWPVIVSCHNFHDMFDNLNILYNKLRKCGNRAIRAVKIVPTAQCMADLSAVHAFLSSSKQVPAACFAMGAAGMASRILALAWGSVLTYTALDESVAPGQLSLSQFIKGFQKGKPDKPMLAVCGEAGLVASWLQTVQQDQNAARHFNSFCLLPFPAMAGNEDASFVFQSGASGAVSLSLRPGLENRPENLTLELDKPCQKTVVFSEKIDFKERLSLASAFFKG